MDRAHAENKATESTKEGLYKLRDIEAFSMGWPGSTWVKEVLFIYVVAVTSALLWFS